MATAGVATATVVTVIVGVAAAVVVLAAATTTVAAEKKIEKSVATAITIITHLYFVPLS